MVSRNYLAIYRPELTYLGYWAECVALGAAMLMEIIERADPKLVAEPRSSACAEAAGNYEGFFAGLEDGTSILFCPSMSDREALLPYIGILCGGNSL